MEVAEEHQWDVVQVSGTALLVTPAREGRGGLASAGKGGTHAQNEISRGHPQKTHQ